MPAASDATIDALVRAGVTNAAGVTTPGLITEALLREWGVPEPFQIRVVLAAAATTSSTPAQVAPPPEPSRAQYMPLYQFKLKNDLRCSAYFMSQSSSYSGCEIGIGYKGISAKLSMKDIEEQATQGGAHFVAVNGPEITINVAVDERGRPIDPPTFEQARLMFESAKNCVSMEQLTCVMAQARIAN